MINHKVSLLITALLPRELWRIKSNFKFAVLTLEEWSPSGDRSTASIAGLVGSRSTLCCEFLVVAEGLLVLATPACITPTVTVAGLTKVEA